MRNLWVPSSDWGMYLTPNQIQNPGPGIITSLSL